MSLTPVKNADKKSALRHPLLVIVVFASLIGGSLACGLPPWPQLVVATANDNGNDNGFDNAVSV